MMGPVLGLEPVPDATRPAGVAPAQVEALGALLVDARRGAPLVVRCRHTGLRLRWLAPETRPETTPHAASLPGQGLWLSERPVPVAAYARYLEASGEAAPPCWAQLATRPEVAMVHVTWAEARAFTAWAGGRLPLVHELRAVRRGLDAPEAAAARAPAAALGEPADLLVRHGLRADDPDQLPAILAAMPAGGEATAGPMGFEDLAGAAFDWALDWARMSASPANPFAATTSNERCFVGASWLGSPNLGHYQATATRPPGWSDLETGFRLARPLCDPEGMGPTWSPRTSERRRGAPRSPGHARA